MTIQAAEQSTPVKGNAHPAFSWIRSERIESLNVTVEEYQHIKTGAMHYHIDADNNENVFLVAFRTVPMDSTGVAHILEHTALCGSKKYPVRDPFFMMIRRSLNTFMNAFTSSDWTAYPFASQNKKDFNNLMEVYLDAVFFASLNELDFAQEGHRVEFATPDDPDSELLFKGVVFNEMKGAYSSPDAIAYRQRMGLLDYDERMAVLIQKVVGARNGDYYMPSLAGVAFSHNPFRWTNKIRRKDGFLRLVWGMGTRAVDRVADRDRCDRGGDDEHPALLAGGSLQAVALHDLRRPDHRLQFPRRPDLRLAGSAGELPMSATDAVSGRPDRGRSLWSDARRRLLSNRAAVTAGGILLTLAALVIVGPWLSPYEYDQTDWGMISIPPDLASGHLFGTDSLGRDLFVRTLQGGRMSLLVGVVATLVSLVIGVAWGATAGYFGGRVDHVMMRIVDILYAMPFMFFVILLMVLFGRHILLIFVAIGAINWLDMARIVRGQTLSVKEEEFVTAADAVGTRQSRILSRHIFPNVLSPIMVAATLGVANAILTESALSFLGLGFPSDFPTWGRLLFDGKDFLIFTPWVVIWPGLFISLTVLSINFMGDGLRDALDPRLRDR